MAEVTSAVPLPPDAVKAIETAIAERTGRNHRAFIWEFSQPGGPVVFDFKMGRGREGPREFLQGFKGKLQSDGYGVYDKLGEGIVYVGCMAHTRRAMDPKFGQVFIYEHCLPFDVSRAYDEATQYRDPRIWTAERDKEMWQALEG